MSGPFHELPLEELVLPIVSTQSGHLLVDLVPLRLRVNDQAILKNISVYHQSVVQNQFELPAEWCRKHQASFDVDFTLVFSE